MFEGKLERCIAETGGTLCVGLDPHPDRIPSRYPKSPEGVQAFLCRIIDETAAHACVFKPNSAFFEALGPRGMDALAKVIRHAHAAERPVILDAKRCDIASSAAAYACAAFDRLGADAITVVPYTGEDAVLPFVETGGTVFLLCAPSNPSAAAIAGHGDPPLYVRVARLGADLATRFPGQVGLVVGLTDPAAAGALDPVAATVPWLVPGAGTQGGDLAAFASAISPRRTVLINASRSVIFAPDPATAARTLRERIGEVFANH
jgi:orotidine 5'-phosphate decarboxylase subfamily 2